MKQFRQGDVLLVQVDDAPAGAVREKRRGDLILEYGEVTGHAHRITTKKVVLLSKGANRFIKVAEAAAILTHEEHSPIRLEKGVYKRGFQVEYTPAELRQVAD